MRMLYLPSVALGSLFLESVIYLGCHALGQYANFSAPSNVLSSLFYI